MTVAELIQQIRTASDNLLFQTVIDTINAHYAYTPTTFRNGVGAARVVNPAGTNEGSCRVFAFAQLQRLDERETLHCFGEHYRSVLNTPQGGDHANIRRFMRDGWSGIAFEGEALRPK